MAQGWSITLGKMFGIPVRVHFTLLILLAFVFFSSAGVAGLVMTVMVFFSVLLHELGHALTARAKGLPIADIALYPFGGIARMLQPPKTARDEVLIAAAGPLASLALAGVCWAISWALADEAWLTLARINALLGLFNLLPALPMDGGRIFRAALATRMGYYRATALSAQVARYLALAMGVVGLVYSGWLTVLAVFLLFMALAEEGVARIRYFMGDPGYQSGEGQQPWGFDPLRKNAGQTGTKVGDTGWEIVDD